MDHEVVIVGGGFSGIGAAIELSRAGFDDVLLLESGERFGGTWQWNTYPGVAVDIPSFSYQFSFEKRGDWSRVYAPGEELRAYAESCATKYGLHTKTRFGTWVDGAAFDDERDLWTLTTAAGEEITARYVVDATGVLTQPKKPDIAGVEDFAGITQHTARWDHSQPTAGRRVGVIGTGASAVQLIPAIVDEAQHVTVFQRTPIWCLRKPDGPIGRVARWVLSHVPGAKAVARMFSQTFVELTFPLSAHFYSLLPVAKLGERSALKYLEQEVHDPEVRDKLTPRYALGCKRPSFHDKYLSTFNRPDVHLETTSIDRVVSNGVITSDGVTHELDVMVLATGFKVFEQGNMPPFPVTGAGGLDLERYWDESRYQAYQGVSVPGFPNYFLMFGPYGYNGSSYFNLVETQAAHIVRLLDHARGAAATRVDVTSEANDRYFAEMLRRRKHQVMKRADCSRSNSYYFDKHGDVQLRPVTTLETIWRSRRFPLEDYRFTATPARRPAEPVAG